MQLPQIQLTWGLMDIEELFYYIMEPLVFIIIPHFSTQNFNFLYSWQSFTLYKEEKIGFSFYFPL